MAENSAIEWCDATFNPWIGCTRVSTAANGGGGCDNCYAAVSTPARAMGIAWGAGEPRRRTVASNWAQPSRWNDQHAEFFAAHGRRRRVFCASLADVFDNEVPTAWRRDLFALIAATPNLDWLLLTKRIGNAQGMVAEALIEHDLHDGPEKLPEWPWPNVWLGATVVNQKEADRDIPKLLATPARVRFLSMEPLLRPVRLQWLFRRATGCDGMPGLHWVIVGGESGHGARPMHPDWARSLRDQCAAAGVPFLFKQWGEFLPAGANEGDPAIADVPDSRLFWSDGSKWDRFDGQRAGVDLVARVGKKAAGRMLDGVTHDGFPRILS